MFSALRVWSCQPGYCAYEKIFVKVDNFLICLINRQTDIYFIDRNKSHYTFICHSNKRDIYTCIYKIVSLGKSYMTIYMVTTKIMLNGIAIIKTGYFSNTNDYFLK